MRVRPWAEFRPDLPDDQIEDDSGIVQFGGKSVIAAIGEMLVRCGCEVSEPDYAYENGWQIFIRAGKRHLWCQVTLIDKYLLVLEEKSWIPKAFRSHSREYLEALARLGRDLANDTRFHDVQWYEADEVQRGQPGTVAPIID